MRSGYRITSARGVDFGVWAGQTPAEALCALHRGAGYDVGWDGAVDALVWPSEDVRRLCGGLERWRVVRVPRVTVAADGGVCLDGVRAGEVDACGVWWQRADSVGRHGVVRLEGLRAAVAWARTNGDIDDERVKRWPRLLRQTLGLGGSEASCASR